MIEFTIPIKMTAEWSLNKLYSGIHWAKRKAQADMIHEAVQWKLLALKPKMFEKPVAVEILYDCKLDIDNCGYMSKLIIDGLKGTVIKDDTKKYVAKLSQGFWDGGEIKVKVRENDD